jgi:hypothetical protein
MATIPDGIVLKRHRDLEGRGHHAWIRRALIVLVGLVPLLALTNLFGQRPHVATATSTAADLELYAPGHVRGGLLWEARFTVTAHRELKDARLELDKGWLEGMTVNTIEPSPVGEGSNDGKLVLDLGHVPSGQRYILFMQFQVNPTTVGSRTLRAELDDGEQSVLTISRRLRIFP